MTSAAPIFFAFDIGQQQQFAVECVRLLQRPGIDVVVEERATQITRSMLPKCLSLTSRYPPVSEYLSPA
jgi:hypothetical protein